MGILDTHADELVQAGRDAPYIAPPKPAAKFSAWGVATAIPRGIGEAAGQVGASMVDLGNAFRYMRDATPEQRKQIDRGGVPIEQYSSELGDTVRDYWREARPDPQTASTAEQVLYGFSRGAAKIIPAAIAGGPAGVLAVAGEEAFSQSDDLRRAGVTDPNVRGAAGAVQGAGLALAVLPVLGQTAAATAALYAVGGPGGFMAQQALTRKILQDAGHAETGAQFDPFDPVGLAVATLIPAGFAAYGLRSRAKAARTDETAPPASERAPGEAEVAPPAIDAPAAPEVVDAARVAFSVEQRQAANLGDGSPKAEQAHDAAMNRAEQQIAAGERVEVDGVEPANMQRAFEMADGLGKSLRAVIDSEPAPVARPVEPPAQPLDAPPTLDQAMRQEVEQIITTIEEATGLPLREPAKPQAEPEAPDPVAVRLDAVSMQFPDLQVRLDGMDAPMRLADFLAAAKAEADAEIADAPLYQLAAECFLANGA